MDCKLTFHCFTGLLMVFVIDVSESSNNSATSITAGGRNNSIAGGTNKGSKGGKGLRGPGNNTANGNPGGNMTGAAEPPTSDDQGWKVS